MKFSKWKKMTWWKKKFFLNKYFNKISTNFQKDVPLRALPVESSSPLRQMSVVPTTFPSWISFNLFFLRSIYCMRVQILIASPVRQKLLFFGGIGASRWQPAIYMWLVVFFLLSYFFTVWWSFFRSFECFCVLLHTAEVKWIFGAAVRARFT